MTVPFRFEFQHLKTIRFSTSNLCHYVYTLKNHHVQDEKPLVKVKALWLPKLYLIEQLGPRIAINTEE
jgi:hypothetical protein